MGKNTEAPRRVSIIQSKHDFIVVPVKADILPPSLSPLFMLHTPHTSLPVRHIRFKTSIKMLFHVSLPLTVMNLAPNFQICTQFPSQITPLQES